MSGPETFGTNETFPDVHIPGVYLGLWCRCGHYVWNYTEDEFPYCFCCEPPHDDEKRSWTLDEVLRVFGPSEE